MNSQKFTSLSQEERIKILVRAQEIMLRSKDKSGPASKFLATEQNIEEYKTQFISLLRTYKGNVYQDENSILLYNFVKLPNKPIKEINLKELAAVLKYTFPVEDYDTISIDFYVTNNIANIFNVQKALWRPQLKYVLFARHNDLKVYPIKGILDLISRRF